MMSTSFEKSKLEWPFVSKIRSPKNQNVCLRILPAAVQLQKNEMMPKKRWYWCVLLYYWAAAVNFFDFFKNLIFFFGSIPNFSYQRKERNKRSLRWYSNHNFCPNSLPLEKLFDSDKLVGKITFFLMILMKTKRSLQDS